jgi:hypothetical protein
VVIVNKVDYRAIAKKENMNKIKEWVLGIALLAASPFLLFFTIMVMIFFKMPIMIYMLYNEIWQEYKEEKRNAK